MTEVPTEVAHGQTTYLITPEGPYRSDLRRLVMDHFEEMIATSAPETSHALQVDRLEQADITLFSVRKDDVLLACGALKELDSHTGEVKTMRTVAEARGLGIGGLMLDHLISVARARGYDTVYLETGSEDFFGPARAMYAGRGFHHCGPFGDYQVDPHSVFMSLRLADSQAKRQ